MDPDIPAQEWDLRGLSSWAASRFSVQLSQNQLRKMSPQDVENQLTEEAIEKLAKVDISQIGQYLEPDYPANSLAEWARSQFGLEVDPDSLSSNPDQAIDSLIEQAEQLYRRREIEYPVEYAMEMTLGSRGADNIYAFDALADWANRKYQAGWEGSQLAEKKPKDIHADLVELSEAWMRNGRLEETVRSAAAGKDADWAVQYARDRFDTEMSPGDFDGDIPGRLIRVGQSFLRREMTELERFVLLQIYDSAWKDHLLAMDHLRNSIGLRSGAEQDPRVAFKREGSQMFNEMLTGVRNKVTDMIFKVRLAAEEQVSNVYEVSNTVHEQLSGYDHLAQNMADQQQAAEPKKVETITRDEPKVGRNDPCPCGSGKKFKKCCGKN
ncbi:MAG: SEC-C metal-binding domain-containing protein [Phycisphaerae bacterium]